MTGRQWPLTEPLRFSMQTKTIKLLDVLSDTGMYGRDRGDVARNLITSGIRKAMIDHPEIFKRGVPPLAKC